METAAFAIRSAGAKDQQQMAYAIIGQLLFLLAPLCTNASRISQAPWLTSGGRGINAFAYMTVARMIDSGLPHQKVWELEAKLTLLFVWLDIACFLVQGRGSLLGDNTNEKLTKLGTNIYVAGIALQLAFIVIFCTGTVESRSFALQGIPWQDGTDG